jgi:uroporphyrinogen-III synthase
MKPLIVLRPEPGASATVAKARALGLDARSHPLFAIHPVAWDPPAADAFDALLVTSANAMRHGGGALSRYVHLPLLAVGAATGAAARKAGFRAVSEGADDGAALLAMAAAAGYRHLLHLAGRDHRALQTTDIVVERRIVYDAVEQPPGTGLVAMLAAPCVALVHSPRAAKAFARLVSDRSHIAIVAISAAAAAAAESGWADVVVADAPDDARMLALAAPLCQNGSVAGE